MNALNRQFELIRQSATVAMADRILALKASGQPIIGLQVGDPDFGTPPAVLAAASRALQAGLTHYGPSSGYLDLRQAIATKLQRDEGVVYDPASEILVTHGGIHAYYTALQAILNPGDEVLVPDPTWATHANMVVMLRGEAVRVPAPAEHGFIPPLEAWAQALTPKTRAIVLNYPSNPTGAYPTRDYLEQLQAFAEAHDLWVVSDEVYGSLYYGERPTSAAAVAGAKDRTLIVNSLSKTYAMTGWRVGWLIGPADVVKAATNLQSHATSNVANVSQIAALAAVSGDLSAVNDMRIAFDRRRKLIVGLLDAIPGVTCPMPEGAFYVYPSVRDIVGRTLRGSTIESSAQLAGLILDEVEVAVVPGEAFGTPGYLRLSYATSDSDITEGVGRMAALLAEAN